MIAFSKCVKALRFNNRTVQTLKSCRSKCNRLVDQLSSLVLLLNWDLTGSEHRSRCVCCGRLWLSLPEYSTPCQAVESDLPSCSDCFEHCIISQLCAQQFERERRRLARMSKDKPHLHWQQKTTNAHTCMFFLSSSAVLQTYLTINTRTRPDCQPCCSPQTWWESCIPSTLSCCMVSCQRWLPQDKNSTTPESFKWLCRAFDSSTVLPCWIYQPSRYSTYTILEFEIIS